MKLVSELVSDKALQGIGRLLSLTRSLEQDLDSPEGFSYNVVSPELGLCNALSAGRLDCQVRDLSLSKLERHVQTPEMLFAMEGDSVICVAPPQEPKDGVLKGLKAVRVAKGQALILDHGAWHWIPFPTGKRATCFLVIFRAKTGADDLDFCDLAHPLTLELNQ